MHTPGLVIRNKAHDKPLTRMTFVSYCYFSGDKNKLIEGMRELEPPSPKRSARVLHAVQSAPPGRNEPVWRVSPGNKTTADGRDSVTEKVENEIQPWFPAFKQVDTQKSGVLLPVCNGIWQVYSLQVPVSG